MGAGISKLPLLMMSLNSVMSYLAINVGHLSTQDNSTYGTLNLHASKRSPPGLGVSHRIRNHPALIQINFHIGVNLLRKTKDTRWVCVKFSNDVLKNKGNSFMVGEVTKKISEQFQLKMLGTSGLETGHHTHCESLCTHSPHIVNSHYTLGMLYRDFACT